MLRPRLALPALHFTAPSLDFVATCWPAYPRVGTVDPSQQTIAPVALTL